MKKVIFLVILLLATPLLLAQTPFDVGGVEVTPPDNLRDLERGKRRALAALGDSVEGRYYLVAQLDHLPTREERAVLVANGLTLHDYLGGNAYFVSFSTGGELASRLRGTHIVSLFPMPAEAKYGRLIRAGEIPDYARRGSRVGIRLSYFGDFTTDWVRSQLQPYGLRSQDHVIGEPFYSLEMWVPYAEIDRLAQLPWIKHIGLVSPPQELFDSHSSSQLPSIRPKRLLE